MSALGVVALITAISLLVYLVVSLVRAQRF